MSTNFRKIKATEKELTLKAITESAKRLSGEYPALTFINEILTEGEKISIGRRILIAQMILLGKTQREICGSLGVSPNTFTLTRKWLDEQIPDYNSVIKSEKSKSVELAEKRKKKQTVARKDFADPLSFTRMRSKYPAHFLLFNLAEELLNQLEKNNKAS